MSEIIKEKYKDTKLGLIPAHWEIKTLGDIGKTINGLTYSPNDIHKDGVLVFRSSNVQNRQIELEDNVFVSVDKDNYNPVKENDLLICVRNGSRSLIGKNALIKKEHEGLAFGAFMSIFRSEDNSYLYQLFDTDIYNREIHRNLGATINSINGGNLKKFKFPFPPKKERDRITQILSQWDEAIETSQNLIEKLKLRKKGLMQELLSGKKRLDGFDEEWNEEPLGKFIRYTPRPKEKPKNHYLALGLRSHGKGIFHKNNFDPDSIAMDTLYEVRENDLVVNITFAWEHAIAIANSKDEGGLVSHRFPTYTFVKNQSDPIFFRYYVLQKRFKYLLNVISPGGAGRNRVMSKKDFPKLLVKVPQFNEQVAISNVLSSVDNEIEIMLERLKTQKTQKKGLMQQLLTGQKRVKID
ncbi:restriction endonuclease subunit S [Maribacter sp. 1_MG-2023]|uniref:restriction endonuclease subunit S n=1 Tax=Maribacter sp. 1_MG-2023 TaxID=3062677 RepID=UPI0026E311CB|nr:restriction endonuclease subunit S [Maribacter sp. 1_MG-2023]MDO6472762.1 restriction endonuclease subunit S [Maribacter sp. 1_MG-2023]